MSILWFLVVVISAGVLGALARQTIVASTPAVPSDGGTALKAPGFVGFDFLSAVILGAAASLIVPLFLSIGKNTIVSSILSSTATNVASDVLVVVGFCVLAGATAPGFIDTLAKKALVVAEANQQKVKALAAETQVAKELIAEERENRSDAPGAGRPQTVRPFDATTIGGSPQSFPSSQRLVVEAIAVGPYRLRSIGGISTELGMDRGQTVTAVRELMARGVLEAKASRTGVELYGLKTPPTG